MDDEIGRGGANAPDLPWSKVPRVPMQSAAVGYFRLPLGVRATREMSAMQQHSKKVLRVLWDHP
jgi:hypothetical protein